MGAVVCSPFVYANSNSQTLSVISWNVWFDDVSGKVRYPLILDELESEQADIVLLQEVTSTFLKALKQHPISKSYFLIESSERKSYQNIVLTRQKPQSSSVLALTSNMQRSAQLVELQLPILDDMLTVVNVHLESPLSDHSVRKEQLVQVLASAREAKNLLLGGDFNFGNGSEEEAFISGVLEDSAKGSGFTSTPTYDVDSNPWAEETKYWFEPSRRLDRIYQRFERGVYFNYKLIGQRPIPATERHLSDHFGVRVDISVSPE